MTTGASEEIDRILRNADDWRGTLLAEVRRTVRDADPTIVEEVKWRKPSRPEGVPVWSRDGIVCIGEMLRSAVRVTFPNGAHLEDPNSLFNARLGGNTVRAVDLHEGDELPRSALQSLVVAAVERNRG